MSEQHTSGAEDTRAEKLQTGDTGADDGCRAGAGDTGAGHVGHAGAEDTGADVNRDRADTLEKLMRILNVADEKGVLNMVEYFVDEIDELLDAGVQTMTTPRALRRFKSVGTLLEAGEAIDVDSMPQAAKAVNGFLQGFAHPDERIRVHNVFDLMGQLKDPDVRIALSAIFSGLKGLGQAVKRSEG